ncbi:MAG: DUF1854 domain-containing protein [Oscillospiraceae bacterium]|jgi:hypothetical protein|nr:DUF1854 domain-containing protein [Oscillospiraceae bacterium]
MAVKEKQTELDALQADFTAPSRCRFYQNARGFLCLALDGEDKNRVQLTRALPISDPEKYIAVTDMESKELALLESLAALDDAQRALVAAELGMRYFCPKITLVKSLKEKMGSYYFDVSIDGIARAVTVHDIGKSMKQLEGGRILLQDVDGNRYEIPDVFALPGKTLRILEPYLY